MILQKIYKEKIHNNYHILKEYRKNKLETS